MTRQQQPTQRSDARQARRQPVAYRAYLPIGWLPIRNDASVDQCFRCTATLFGDEAVAGTIKVRRDYFMGCFEVALCVTCMQLAKAERHARGQATAKRNREVPLTTDKATWLREREADEAKRKAIRKYMRKNPRRARSEAHR